jgi:hypothetical protein
VILYCILFTRRKLTGNSVTTVKLPHCDSPYQLSNNNLLPTGSAFTFSTLDFRDVHCTLNMDFKSVCLHVTCGTSIFKIIYHRAGNKPVNHKTYMPPLLPQPLCDSFCHPDESTVILSVYYTLSRFQHKGHHRSSLPPSQSGQLAPPLAAPSPPPPHTRCVHFTPPTPKNMAPTTTQTV